MDTSDDPITLTHVVLAAGGAFFAGQALSKGGGGGKVSIPTRKAENVKRTAEPLEQVSEAGRERRRRRRQASTLTSEFGQPQLGIPGLTGLQDQRLS